MSESQNTDVAEVVKFHLPDGRSVDISSAMSGAELTCALQQIVDVYFPPPAVEDPHAEALAHTEAYLKKMASLHSIAVVAYTEPMRSADELTPDAVYNAITKGNLPENDPRMRQAFSAVIQAMSLTNSPIM
jgi:hypothetical protein